MEYIYAVMLLNKAGKEVSESNVVAVLKAAGIDGDSAKIKSLIAALDGVDIQKIIEESSVGVAPIASTVAPVAGTSAPVVEEKKEETPQVDASAGLGSLF